MEKENMKEQENIKKELKRIKAIRHQLQYLRGIEVGVCGYNKFLYKEINSIRETIKNSVDGLEKDLKKY